MYFKSVKRKCSVRGCKNTDCFAISRSREIGNTVIICKDCLENALSSVNDINNASQSDVSSKHNTAAPPLFFNEEALGLKDDTVIIDETNTYQNSEEKSSDDFTDADKSDSENEHSDMAGEVETENISSGDDGIKTAEFVCSGCGRVFETERGLKQHFKSCKQSIV